MDRENGDEVNEEPEFEVVPRNRSSIVDEFLDQVVVGREEAEDDVEEVNHVDHNFDEEPVAFAFLEKGDAVGSHHSAEEAGPSLSSHLQKNQDIPLLLPRIVGQDNAFGVVLQIS